MGVEILSIDSHTGLVFFGLVNLTHLFLVELAHDFGDLLVGLSLVPADQHAL